jgi:hypothetical protein
MVASSKNPKALVFRSARRSPRMLLAAWLAFMGLWPLQAAAYHSGPRMTAMCRMMPHMAGMKKRSHGLGHGMSACRQLQCQHRVGPGTVGVIVAQPAMVVQPFTMLPETPAPVFAPRADRHASRAPPPYLRFARLLI